MELSIPLLARLPSLPVWVVADRGYSSHAFREHVWSLGARPAIPPKVNEAPVVCPEPIYNNRNRVERLWARLKEWRAVATWSSSCACPGARAKATARPALSAITQALVPYPPRERPGASPAPRSVGAGPFLAAPAAFC
jgi:hypothetical protein